MELKLMQDAGGQKVVITFNRTTMELKLVVPFSNPALCATF